MSKNWLCRLGLHKMFETHVIEVGGGGYDPPTRYCDAICTRDGCNAVYLGLTNYREKQRRKAEAEKVRKETAIKAKQKWEQLYLKQI